MTAKSCTLEHYFASIVDAAASRILSARQRRWANPDCRVPANSAGASVGVLCPALTENGYMRGSTESGPKWNLTRQDCPGRSSPARALAKITSWIYRLSKLCTTTGQIACNHLQDMSLCDDEHESSRWRCCYRNALMRLAR
ncbi:hypothetical protein IG631_23549 [Alternaria alternata]|nr:hypothetical protein IG631_23549 [Alternaria alternata]